MAERPSVGKHVPPTGQRAEVLFSRSAIAAADVTLFVCLHRLRFVSAGIFYPRSAQVELFSEPLRSVLKVSGSFALCQPHANMYMYTHTKAFDLCAFVLLLFSLQYLPAYQMIYEHSSHIPPVRVARIAYNRQQQIRLVMFFVPPSEHRTKPPWRSSPRSSSSPGEYQTCQNELPALEYPRLPGRHVNVGS